MLDTSRGESHPRRSRFTFFPDPLLLSLQVCVFHRSLSPVSYFKDVYLSDTIEGEEEEFPASAFAKSSPVGSQGDELPIGGTVDPLKMTHPHRADFVRTDGSGKYRHFNLTDSDAWNQLWICFIPAEFDGSGNKVRNAHLQTKVNGNEVFNDELKTGTRSARYRDGKDPEKNLYVDGNTDKKIRILGHWGSIVKFKDVVIKSEGSEG